MVQLLVVIAELLHLAFAAQPSSFNITSVLELANTHARDIAALAVINSNRSLCESLQNCTKATCSRRSCSPRGEYEIGDLQCLAMSNNSGICPGDNALVSTKESYIRLSSASNETNPELQASLCLQKSIDKKLQQVWLESGEDYRGWVFFGTPEGSFYVFPGRDYPRCQEFEYDPRKRPWYINSLAVVKSVHVLFDDSSSMNLHVSNILPETRLEAAQKMVNELLSTLSNQDCIAVSSIDGRRITGQDTPIIVSKDTSDTQQDIQALQDSIQHVKATWSVQADIKLGLDNATKFFQSRPNSDLKVLFIFSDGSFASGMGLNASSLDAMIKGFQELREQNVVIFFYKIGSTPELPSIDTSLQQLQGVVSMTFETVTDLYDPLLKLRRYFDYLAWLRHVNTNRTVLWVPLFTDFDGLGNLTTATFPAFDANQKLIGIAGIDILTSVFIDKIGISAVQEALEAQGLSLTAPSKLGSPPPPVQTSANYSTTFAGCDHGINRTMIQPLCPGIDTKTSMLEFICCPGHKSKKMHTGQIIGYSSAGLGLVLVAVGVTIYVLVRKRQIKRKETVDPIEENNEYIKPPWLDQLRINTFST